MAEGKKAFLICPVRGHEMSELETLVECLEAEGWDVHWPPRDTKQTDTTGGYNICQENVEAIRQADMVFLVWDGESQGVLFDAGAAFMAKKKITVLSCPPNVEVPGKSFQNMFRYWQAQNQ